MARKQLRYIKRYILSDISVILKRSNYVGLIFVNKKTVLKIY